MGRKLIVAMLLFVCHFNVSGQTNRSGARWILGAARGVEAEFTDTSRPKIKVIYGATPHYYDGGHSNICDSATGKLLFSCNGMVLYDSVGNIMDNGDHLVESSYYYYNAFPSSSVTQASLILPKGNYGHYYVFITTISDSAWDYYVNIGGGAVVPCDRLQVNIIDMNANGGLGSVLVKNKPILQGVAIHKTMMQACRHSNGIDWWLLKQGEYDTNRIYRFLIKPDTIEGPWIQSFAEPKYPSFDLMGQYAFSKDGTKFASVQGRGKMNKLFMADFDRCTGELNNPKIFNIPIDSTTFLFIDTVGQLDSVNMGVCFSPNGDFIYLSKRFNIYQYQYNEPDSFIAWYRVQHGPDTSQQKFQQYAHLYLGLDNRIYIGNVAGGYKQMSVIDKPDIKGVGCQFCRKCFRLDTNVLFGMTSPPNMPDYNLGASGQVCWPLNSSEIRDKSSESMEVWPNPASTRLFIKTKIKKERELFNSVGQLLITTKENEIDVSRYAKGIYYLKCNSLVVKINIE